MNSTKFIFIFTGIIWCNTVFATPGFDLPAAIRSADIDRDHAENAASIPLYQGNGRWGCAYGMFGLHDRPNQVNKFGKTQYMHLQHHVRAKFNADYLLPMAKIYWDKVPEKTTQYNQHQSFYDGTICTQFTLETGKVKNTTWFDPVNRNMAGIEIQLNGRASDIILEPFGETPVHYDQVLMQKSEISKESGIWKIDISCENITTSMYVKTNADVKLENNHLRFQLHQGKNEILISVNVPIQASNAQSLAETIKWWHDKWLNSGSLMIPDQKAQDMWVRSMAMFLASYNDDGAGLTPPCGFTGNGWPFPFPQDVSYIHPILLSTGNINIAKSWVEHFSSGLEGMKEYTKRLSGANGILCPWVYPYGDFDGYHNPAPPNKFYYEIHNSGYLARMANETAIFVNDDAWTKKHAIPLIKETADFYKSISTKGNDELWHLFVTPSMGQDEMGGADQKDYLCALYSAKYCFQLAIAYGLDTDGSFRQILNGLAFQGLLSPQDIYYTCLGSGNTDFGKQKHPVQLNALAYLPVDSDMSGPSGEAYRSRYEITVNANKPYFHGWTLGTFLLAGSRYGSTKEWLKDWNNLRKSDYVDAEWIQIYETSQSYGSSYYNTTNGLVAQSLLNNLVSDWYGKLEIAKCNPWRGNVYVKNIYSKLGVVIDGTVNGKNAQLQLKAWKDTEFELNGETIKLKRGEVIERNI